MFEPSTCRGCWLRLHQLKKYRGLTPSGTLVLVIGGHASLSWSVQSGADNTTGRCFVSFQRPPQAVFPHIHHSGIDFLLLLAATYRKHLNADRILMVFTNINICFVEVMLRKILKLLAKQMKAWGRHAFGLVEGNCCLDVSIVKLKGTVAWP